MKKNEQGLWQRRYICTVPHTFLYYYESETSENPRGVIDMELFTDISIDNETLTLGTNDPKLRMYYFKDDKDIGVHENLSDWLNSLNRDRYNHVCEERDAYQGMQSELTGVLDSASTMQIEQEKEKLQVEGELRVVDHNYSEALTVMRDVLVTLGITEEDMNTVSESSKKMGNMLKAGILDMRNRMQNMEVSSKEALTSEQTQSQIYVKVKDQQMEIEKQAVKNMELLLLKERREGDIRLQDSMKQTDTANLNTQMAMTAKTAANSKVICKSNASL